MKNKYEILFDDMLELMEFELIKYPNNWGLIDKQGGNLGNIESDRFEDAFQIIDRLDLYIDDYLARSIKECLDINDDFSWSEIAHKYINHPELAGESYYDIQMLDMICHHGGDIDLNHCYFTLAFDYFEKNKKQSFKRKVNIKVIEEECEDTYLTVYIPDNISQEQFNKDYEMAVKYAQSTCIEDDPNNYDEDYEYMSGFRDSTNGEQTFIEYLERKGYIVNYFNFDLEFEW